MRYVECRTQAELDAALALPDVCPHLVGAGYFVVRGSATVRAWGSATVRAGDSATVEAWGSATVRAGDSATVRAGDSATVEAWGSATVRAGDSATVEAWGSATVRAWGSATVRAWGSATVRAWGSATVRAWGSATVRAWGSATVRAWGSATVRAWGSATVRAGDSATVRAGDSATVEAWGAVMARLLGKATCVATSPHVVTTVHGKRAKATGGHIIAIPDVKTAEDFCTWNGIEVEKVSGRKVVHLFKAVDDNYKSTHGFRYGPGDAPEAPDWEPSNGCGRGLHFGATPMQAKKYHSSSATRFVRCPVYLSEVAPIVDLDGTCDKVKAKRIIAPGCVEVDIDGELLA